ncbi:hypothetical protein Pan44_01360 [Caulifigura coniformis]|uniref:Uncharacterized protein n=1 Tax=Caulifigura coniformis TaxID=2527983 RepID=A0A517S7M9_9PLAN|nr:hypothetical protein [Caulifigura coniformis]QDT52127.1 hypothetical protein Pan44_01360 [Caulifigura coniformis]
MKSGDLTLESAPAAPPRARLIRVMIAVLLIGGATLIVRAAPWFDPDVAELTGRLLRVRQEADAARGSAESWRDFAEPANVELKTIAQDARRAHQRRQGPWRWIAGEDRREEAALREAQRIAESDLPALIAAGPKGNPLRERTVADALARLDDHLGGASPYLPPLRPIENQAGLDRDAEATPASPGWLLKLLVVDAVLVGLGLLWWWRRSMISRRAGLNRASRKVD